MYLGLYCDFTVKLVEWLYWLNSITNCPPDPIHFPFKSNVIKQMQVSMSLCASRPLFSVSTAVPFSNSHAVEELPVRLVSFALRHQAVQLVDQLGLHLWGRKENEHLNLKGAVGSNGIDKMTGRKSSVGGLELKTEQCVRSNHFTSRQSQSHVKVKENASDMFSCFMTSSRIHDKGQKVDRQMVGHKTTVCIVRNVTSLLVSLLFYITLHVCCL